MSSTQPVNPGWKIVFEAITPARAKEMLSVPVKNRSVRPRVVRTYSADMSDSRWRFTPEPIIIDKNGGVLDGQHRLQAVVETGVERVFLVVYNVDPSLIEVLGIGKSRTAAEILKIEGESNTFPLAGAVRVLHNYLTIPPARSWGGDNVTLSPPAVTSVLRQHPRLRDYVPIGAQVASKIAASPSAIIVGVYLTSYERPIEQQDDWLGPLKSGAGLSPGSPALALRELYNSVKIAQRKARIAGGASQRFYLATYLRAWVLWRDGGEIRRLREPEAIPQVGLPQADVATKKPGNGAKTPPAQVQREQGTPLDKALDAISGLTDDEVRSLLDRRKAS